MSPGELILFILMNCWQSWSKHFNWTSSCSGSAWKSSQWFAEECSPNQISVSGMSQATDGAPQGVILSPLLFTVHINTWVGLLWFVLVTKFQKRLQLWAFLFVCAGSVHLLWRPKTWPHIWACVWKMGGWVSNCRQDILNLLSLRRWHLNLLLQISVIRRWISHQVVIWSGKAFGY